MSISYLCEIINTWSFTPLIHNMNICNSRKNFFLKILLMINLGFCLKFFHFYEKHSNVTFRGTPCICKKSINLHNSFKCYCTVLFNEMYSNPGLGYNVMLYYLYNVQIMVKMFFIQWICQNTPIYINIILICW